MRDYTIALDKKDDFEGYCRQLQQIADRLKENEKYARSNKPFLPTRPRLATISSPATAIDHNIMDWEPTRTARVNQGANRGTSRDSPVRRAAWVSQEEI